MNTAFLWQNAKSVKMRLFNTKSPGPGTRQQRHIVEVAGTAERHYSSLASK